MAKRRKREKRPNDQGGLDRHIITMERSELGGYVAEREESILPTYVENEFLEEALRHESRKCFIIGRTGTGKSAILRVVNERNDSADVVFLKADQFTFRQVELSRAIYQIHELGGGLDYIFKTIWKYMLVSQLLRKRYPSLDARRGLLKRALTRATDRRQHLAYQFLVENDEISGDRSFAERLATLLERLDSSAELRLDELSVAGLVKAKAAVSLKSQTTNSPPPASPAVSKEIGRRVRIALEREWNVPMLQEALRLIEDDLLAGRKFWVLIDDLDKSFAGSPLSSQFTRCLFEVIMEMAHAPALRFLVALRTNIFDRLEFYQSEKVMDYCMHITWSPAQLTKMLEARARWFFQFQDSVEIFGSGALFPSTVRHGAAQVRTPAYLIDRTLKRPRDLLMFAQTALRARVGERAVGAKTIREVEQDYSEDRLSALVEEWQEEYPGLEHILDGLTGCPEEMPGHEFIEQIQLVLLKLLEVRSSGDDENPLNLYVQQWSIKNEDDLENPAVLESLADFLHRLGVVEYRAKSSPGWKSFNPRSSAARLRLAQVERSRFRVAPMLWKALAIGEND